MSKSTRARAVAFRTAIATSAFAAGALVVSAIHPDFNTAVRLALVAGALTAWLAYIHTAAVARHEAATLRLDNQIAVLTHSMENRLAAQDQQMTTVVDVARTLVAGRYPTARAVGEDRLQRPERPSLSLLRN